MRKAVGIAYLISVFCTLGSEGSAIGADEQMFCARLADENGNELRVQVGDVSRAGPIGWNDRASRVTIWSGCKLVGYRHSNFQDQLFSHEASMTTLPTFDIANNQLTSWKCSCIPVDCEWNPWSIWTSCSKTCGGQGTMTRTRDIKIEAANGGNDCEGNAKETQECGLEPCPPVPVDCEWNQWSIWTSCSKTCGGQGTMTRMRDFKIEAANGGNDCEGNAKETQECGLEPCPPEECLTVSGKKCVIPWINIHFGYVKYNGCALWSSASTRHCPTQVDASGIRIMETMEECRQSCPRDDWGTTIDVLE